MSDTNGNGKGDDQPMYVRQTKPLGSVEFDVAVAGGVAHFTARNVLFREFNGLEDYVAGEVKEGRDPSGRSRLARRVLKLEQVVTAITNIDPADVEATGGDIGALLRLPGNDDLVWLAWDAYVEALVGARSKSGDVATGGRDREGEPAAGQDGAATAQVSGV